MIIAKEMKDFIVSRNVKTSTRIGNGIWAGNELNATVATQFLMSSRENYPLSALSSDFKNAGNGDNRTNNHSLIKNTIIQLPVQMKMGLRVLRVKW